MDPVLCSLQTFELSEFSYVNITSKDIAIS
jgi:hypothetical protein